MKSFSFTLATALCFATVMGQSASAGNLVFNGGFETGTFLGWNVPPNAPLPDAALFRIGTGDAHTGNHFAGIGSASLQFISQTMPTQAGQDYDLTFWLRRTPNVPGGFAVRWEGNYVFLEILGGPETLAWHQFTIPLHANINGSFLEFGQAFFPGEFHIDTISVVPVPTPSAAPLLLMGGAVAMRRRRR